MNAHEVARDLELLSVRRAARRLGIHRGTCYRLIRQGLIPAVTVGRSIRVDPAALERWISEGGDKE